MIAKGGGFPRISNWDSRATLKEAQQASRPYILIIIILETSHVLDQTHRSDFAFMIQSTRSSSVSPS